MENCIDCLNLLRLAENLIVEDLDVIKKKARKTILENSKNFTIRKEDLLYEIDLLPNSRRRIIFYNPIRFTLYYDFTNKNYSIYESDYNSDIINIAYNHNHYDYDYDYKRGIEKNKYIKEINI